MAKKVIKEIFIMILLLIAIILIFSVLFYEYIPMNKTLPAKIAYQRPIEVEKEIQQAEIKDTAPVNIIYQIEAADLTRYEKTNDYNPGKRNPFSALTSTAPTSGNTTGGTGSSGSSGTGSSQSTDNTGGYFNNAGSK